ncbi:hypothetical protein [Thalassospira sp.]
MDERRVVVLQLQELVVMALNYVLRVRVFWPNMRVSNSFVSWKYDACS